MDNQNFYYADLNRFDEAMIHMLRKSGITGQTPIINLWDREGDQVVAYMRGEYVFVFNWNGVKSFPDYGFLAPEGKYQVVLNTDDPKFAGFEQTDDTVEHFTLPDREYARDKKGWLKLYLPARTAVVLKKVD